MTAAILEMVDVHVDDQRAVLFWGIDGLPPGKRSGSHEVAGALVPLEIDIEQQRGRYEEPNIWVSYAVGSA